MQNAIAENPDLRGNQIWWSGRKGLRTYSKEKKNWRGASLGLCRYSARVHCRMPHRKWRETKKQPSRAKSGHQLSYCLVSLHFLGDILRSGHALQCWILGQNTSVSSHSIPRLFWPWSGGPCSAARSTTWWRGWPRDRPTRRPRQRTSLPSSPNTPRPSTRPGLPGKHGLLGKVSSIFWSTKEPWHVPNF